MLFYRVLLLFALVFVVSEGRKTINWKGYTWNVRHTTTKVGPGINYFNESNVEITSDDKLEMFIRKYGNVHSCASLSCDTVLGYGVYAWDFSVSLESVVDKDENVVVGLFLYMTDEDEIDIEWARWGDPDDGANNINYVAQPDEDGASIYYHFPAGYTHVRHQFNYQKDIIVWKAIDLNTKKVIYEWSTKKNIPLPEDLPAMMNFWMMQGEYEGLSPALPEMSIVIDNFAFNPPDITGSQSSSPSIFDGLFSKLFLFCLVLCFCGW